MAGLSLKGVGVSRGIAIGRAHLLLRNQATVQELVLAPSDVAHEVARFKDAVATAREQLQLIRDKIPTETPVDIASFIDTHMLMLEDKALAVDPIDIIRTRLCNAEWALKLQRDALVAVFDTMDDPYLRTRRDDVEHVVNRIQSVLARQAEQAPLAEGALTGRIIIADDLSPADTVTMQGEGIAGFVTEYGGPTSHTAILARSLGIPAVVGVSSALRYLRQSDELVVDGHNGVIIVGAHEPALDLYRDRISADRRHQQVLRRLKAAPAISRDGLAVSLQANIELPEDLAHAKRVGAKGVGLFRSEFLFMNRETLPDEEEQYHVYRRVVRTLAGSPLTIRTLDLGADKMLSAQRRPELHGAVAANPALGLRAIRLCLRDPGLFKPQLRAILRASADGPINMMVPMLTSVEEIRQTLALITQIKEELRSEGRPFDERMPVGGMIEVPAAAMLAHVFAAHLDFMSIGTNDLIQYSLAADRLDNTLDHFYQQIHPAVLRLIDLTLKAGRKRGIPVSMCGEMAGEPRYTRLLLGLGLSEFSMHPAMVPEIKKIVQETEVEPLRKRVRRVLSLASAAEVERFVERLNQSAGPM